MGRKLQRNVVPRVPFFPYTLPSKKTITFSHLLDSEWTFGLLHCLFFIPLSCIQPVVLIVNVLRLISYFCHSYPPGLLCTLSTSDIRATMETHLNI
jgi:hypothetical protein